MTIQDINGMLEETGLPFAYYQFNEDTAKEPPFVCWYMGDSDDVYADNSNFAGINELTIELYTDVKDFALEASLERILAGAGISWAKSESYIDTEKMHMTIYETEVVINA